MRWRSWFHLSFCQGWTTATLCWRVTRNTTGWIICREYKTMQLILSLVDKGEIMQHLYSDLCTGFQSVLGLSTRFPPCARRSRDSSAPAYLSDLLSTFLFSVFCRRWSHDCSTHQTQQVWKACFLIHRTCDLEFPPQTSAWCSKKSSLKMFLFKMHLYWQLSLSDPPGCWAKLTVSCISVYPV